jgi:hypothetical protein
MLGRPEDRERRRTELPPCGFRWFNCAHHLTSDTYWVESRLFARQERVEAPLGGSVLAFIRVERRPQSHAASRDQSSNTRGDKEPDQTDCDENVRPTTAAAGGETTQEGLPGARALEVAVMASASQSAYVSTACVIDPSRHVASSADRETTAARRRSPSARARRPPRSRRHGGRSRPWSRPAAARTVRRRAARQAREGPRRSSAGSTVCRCRRRPRMAHRGTSRTRRARHAGRQDARAVRLVGSLAEEPDAGAVWARMCEEHGF